MQYAKRVWLLIISCALLVSLGCGGESSIQQNSTDSTDVAGADTAQPGADATTPSGTDTASQPDSTTAPDTTTSDVVSSDPAPTVVSTTATTVIKEFRVTNPNSGVKLYGRIHLPVDASASKTYPVLFLVPGGSGAGSSFEAKGFTERLVALGIIAVHFDLDGRGQSNGSEDYCGTIHQDGVSAIVAYIKGQPEVNTARMGLYSASYGVTCASGLLSRYSATVGIKFYVDWEGPANRDDTGSCGGITIGHITHDCSDEAFWSQREASTLIKGVSVPYLRIQTKVDHVQPDNDHAILMINNATAKTYGGNGISSWTRVNGAENTPNTVYTTNTPPIWLPELPGPKIEDQGLVYIQEMFETFTK